MYFFLKSIQVVVFFRFYNFRMLLPRSFLILEAQKYIARQHLLLHLILLQFH